MSRMEWCILVPILLLLKSLILIPLLTKAAYLDCRQRWVPFEVWYPGIIGVGAMAMIQWVWYFSLPQLIGSAFIGILFYAVFMTGKMGGYDAMSIILLTWFTPELLMPFMLALCMGGIVFWIFLRLWKGKEIANHLPYMVVILAAFLASSLYTMSLYIPV